jgi:hypothetical protein
VSGPADIRAFNLASTATVKAFQPVKINAAGAIVESLGTDSVLAGFILHDAANSVPPGKCLVMVPNDDTIFAGTAAAGLTSNTSSGQTLGVTKSGNSWYLEVSASTKIGMFIVVLREDGSTIDSNDSSVWVQVIQGASYPFHAAVSTPVI